jgi:hypothetical protein
MSKTSGAAPDARLDPRYPAWALPSIVGVRLSPGDAVELVNISKTGVLVEGRTRFVPGTRVTVIFEGSFTPSSKAARVIRCQVSSIVAGALHYHSGIQFDTRLDVLEIKAPAKPPRLPAQASATHTSEPAPQGAKSKNASWPSQPTPARRPVVNRW